MKILETREFRGRNIYSHYPVAKVSIDLEDLKEVWTDQVPGFAEKLCSHLPGLKKHHCSRRREGGLVERLGEGTLFGHVVEHVALEIQAMAGLPALYGKTVSTPQEGVYDVIVEAGLPGAGATAVQSAIAIIEAVRKGIDPEISEKVEMLEYIKIKNGPGPSTAAILAECDRRDIPVMPLGQGSLYQLGYGVYRKSIQAAMTGYTSCIAVDIASDKHLTKELLAREGIPVPAGFLARTEAEAWKAATALKGSVVLKPRHGNQGKGVSVNLNSEGEIKRAFHLAQSYGEEVIVERYIPGRHYRLLVVGNKVAAAAERVPARVTGDGALTVEQLVRQANQNPLRGEGHEKPLTKIRIDPAALLVLARQRMTPDSIPQPGQEVYLRENANLSTGGTARDVTAEVHSVTRDMAVRAARIIGLDIAGIDIVVPDIKRPPDKGGAIIEVNAAPGLRMHLFPEKGPARNVAADIIDYLFPGFTNARIPVVSVTGTNGKTTVTRLIGHIVKQWGKRPGMTTTGGVFVDGECCLKGDTTGPQSAQMVLRDPRVEVAVLETARGGILRAGLGYDKARVGVITNVSEDHLGVGGIQSVEEMAGIKALVVEALEKGGTAVLNGDDPWSMEIARRVTEKIIYFSLLEDNLRVKRHLATGQEAFFVKKNRLIMASGEHYRTILPVRDIPICMGGLAAFNIANALAAAAACYSIGVPLEAIKAGLQTFGLKRIDNPGRCQIYRLGEITVILDYGHNAAALSHVLEFARKMNPVRLFGVIGVPGDRRDRDIIKAGCAAGKLVDYCIIKEDEDPRGRTPGETAALLQEGLRQAGLAQDRQEVVLREAPALITALSKSKPGDCVVVFYEKLEPLEQLLDRLESTTNKRKRETYISAEKKRGMDRNLHPNMLK